MMGCNIHGYIEVRVSPQDIWWAQVKEPRDDRNYTIFAYLADVRNWEGSGIKALSPPRGTPDDVSEEYRAMLDDYGSDAHSESWLYAEEFLTIPIPAEEDGWMMFRHMLFMLSEHYGERNVRFVFFFDN